jgi:tripartite-type tricarboxylate transporter receptor subunit TctC
MAEAVARAAPDGSTLGLLAPSFPVARHVTRNLPFDPQADFTPISLIVTAPVLVLAAPDLPARDLRGLGEVLKAGRSSAPPWARAPSCTCRSCSDPGPRRRVPPRPQSQPGRGDGRPAGGRIQLYFSAAASALPAVRAGRARALAVASPGRIAATPDVPTVAETVPGFEVEAWYGLAGPRGLPPRWRRAWNGRPWRRPATPALAARLREVGTEPVGSTGAEFAERLRAEDAKWGEAARAAGLATK